MPRESKLRCETIKEGDVTLIFFTKSRKFIPTLYDTRPVLRPIIVRRPRSRLLEFALWHGSTYRACRKLSKQYAKDFAILRRPLPSLHFKGHTVVLHYRKGAGGKVVDDSYMMVVGRMAEKLAERYRVRTSVRHSSEARMLIVTFHLGQTADWSTSRMYLS